MSTAPILLPPPDVRDAFRLNGHARKGEKRSEATRQKMRDAWARRKAAKAAAQPSGSSTPPSAARNAPSSPATPTAMTEHCPPTIPLLSLVANASLQLAQVTSLSVAEIEVALQKDLECDRVQLQLEHLVAHSENLLSLVSHCRRMNAVRPKA